MWLLMPAVRREIVLPVEPERAWELITDPDELEGWLADEVELDPEEGGAVHVRFEDGEERWGTVEEADPDPDGVRFGRASCKGGSRADRGSWSGFQKDVASAFRRTAKSG